MKTITVKIPKNWQFIADMIRRHWPDDHEIPSRWSVSAVWRMAISRGLDSLLEELQTGVPASAKESDKR